MNNDINENTELSKTDVKSTFFAQYFGQKILNPYSLLTYTNTGVLQTINSVQLSGIRDNDFLQLKPLSKISDEDAKKIQSTLLNIIGLDGLIRENSIELVKEVISNYSKMDCLFMLPSSCVDKLRELGYAVDWNGLKVSQQIILGWTKLL